MQVIGGTLEKMQLSWKKCTLLPFQIVQNRDEISLCLPPVCNS